MDEPTSITQAPQPLPAHPEKVEPVIYLLFAGMIFFTICMFAAEEFWKDDGQLFTAITGLLSGFSGAFFMRIKQSGEKK